jgi:DNA polymerase-3 subunit delta
VVIVKEAQDLSRTIDKLESYAENQMLTTGLVICYKYKTWTNVKNDQVVSKVGLV